jgi:hypothetical protein
MYAKEVNDMSNGQLQTLRTKTPEEGYKLAVKLAQKGIAITQPSEEIRKMLRPVYSINADSLIATSQVVAIHFQTVAFANNYCKTKCSLKRHFPLLREKCLLLFR